MRLFIFCLLFSINVAFSQEGWLSQTFESSGTSYLEVKMATSNIGWQLSNNRVQKTTNGGRDWMSQIDTLSTGYKSLNTVDTMFVIVVGNNGKILKTTNGGINWAQKPRVDYKI